uniref:Uncharacterized protein n=1 Tax=Arundo donax TaxID=35708 RepID=A0A0A9DD34_ARUDO
MHIDWHKSAKKLIYPWNHMTSFLLRCNAPSLRISKQAASCSFVIFKSVSMDIYVRHR